MAPQITVTSKPIHHYPILQQHSKPMPKYGALWAIILFLLIDVCTSFTAHLCGQRKYKSCENLIKTFENLKNKPDIILLGSSLMRIPLYLTDIEHSYYVANQEDYCWNRTLQNLLNSNKINQHRVFDFAIDGSMVSDVFLVHRKFLSDKDAPKYIVYGIAPRDLLDNFLSKETSTPIFHRLFDLKDIWLSESLFNTSLNEKLDLTLEKICFLYRDRSTIQHNLTDTCSRLKNWKLPTDYGKRWSKGMILDALLSKKISSNKNLRTYQSRYKTFQKTIFDKQKLFLKALCEEARGKGTNVLLVNMPLTPKIINLIPSEACEAYNQTIAEAGKLPGVTVLDLHNSANFPNEYFGDLVHLNGRGGQMLNALIAQKILISDGKQLNQGNNLPSPNNTGALASWWLANAYFSKPTPPDICILGSSQLWPVLGADADAYNVPVDITGDHRSKLIEDDISMLLNESKHVFVGALPGAMISDQLVMARALFSMRYKPKLVAITFSPRDFVDKNFPSRTASEAFAFFSKYTSPVSLRKDLAKMRTQKYEFQPNNDIDFEVKSSLGLGSPFERISPEENMICPGESYSFVDNAKQYQARYANPMSKQLEAQLDSFNSLVKYLTQLHIKVVAFNLPVAASNKKLLSDNFWKYYDERITQICNKNGADYVSVDRSVLPFANDEFIDGVHLNLIGGHRLSKTLALFIANRFHTLSFQDLLKRGEKLK